MIDEELSDAVVEYLGYGKDSRPGSHVDVLREKFGMTRSKILLTNIREIFSAFGDLTPECCALTFEEVSSYVERQMRVRYPELSDEALHSLGFAYMSWGECPMKGRAPVDASSGRWLLLQ